MKNKFFYLALLFCAASCFAQAPEGKLFEIPKPRNYAEQRPEPDRSELTVVMSRDTQELDPRKSYFASEAQVLTGLYEGLFSYNPFNLEPIPGAASHWKLSDDKKTWTFTMRQDAKWSTGDPVRSADFRNAWLSLLSPEKESPYSSLFDIIEGARDYRNGKLSDASKVGISAPDDKTLVVRLASPASFFRSMLCHHSFSPIHPSMLDSEDWSQSSPPCNGAYFVEGRTRGASPSLILAKNKNYWDADKTVLEKIIIRYTDDENEAAEMWNSGESRWIAGNVNLEALHDRSGITVNPMFATHYYYIRAAEGPWRDWRVRRALILALPWEEMRSGHYLPAKTLVYRFPGYPEIKGLEETDIEAAQKLLTEAGFPKGAGLPEIVIRITPAEDADRIAKLMAQAWMDKLGIPARIDVVAYNDYYAALGRKDYTIGAITWIGDFADPYTFLQMWRGDSNLNDAGYDDAEYEALLDKSMTEEGRERFQTLGEAEQLLLDRGTALPISFSPALNIVDPEELGGWYPNALDIHPFKYLNFKAWKPLPGVAVK